MQLAETIIAATMAASALNLHAQQPVPVKPRVLISTDIGGTDPDDNQSMAHLLMYSDKVDIEGLVSSPSYGSGSADEIRRMIDLYEKDYPQLVKHAAGLTCPDSLRRLCKQGCRKQAPYKGYSRPTEGSQWIISQALENSSRPLWILVWGTLDDVAQALHDAPEIKDRIRIYYIGGPNKKWGANSYAYIAENFPDVWMIENNATYRGFIAESGNTDKYNSGYYDYAIRGAGSMGADFIRYYDGLPKMGDTPSFLYMLDGDPENPARSSWGGSFAQTRHSTRHVFDRQLTSADTVAVYSIMELRFKGPDLDIPEDSACFTVTIDKQDWDGYYTGNGTYAVRYSPKASATLTYRTSSAIKELDGKSGEFVVSGTWPGTPDADDYALGGKWFTDRQDSDLFEGKWQGARSIRIWRKDILEDWAARWRWLK